MGFQYTPVTVTLILSTVLSAGGVGLAWTQRKGPTETWAALLQLTLTLWAFLMLLLVSSTTSGGQLFWLLAFIPIMAMLNASAVGFAAHFTGRGEWLTRRRTTLLVAYVAVTAVLAMTNLTHHELFVQNVSLDESGSWAVLQYDWGPLFWVLVGVVYGIAALYVSWLVKFFLHSRNVYRKLSFLILLMNVAVLLGALPSALQVSPLPHFLIVPHVQLVLGGAVLLASASASVARRIPVAGVSKLLPSRFESLDSLARDFVMEAVDNGILVLDDSDRVVDVNRTAKRMIGNERPVGKQFTEITDMDLVEDPGSIGGLLAGREPIREVEDEIWLQTETGKRCYDVRVSQLGEGESIAGHVILLHDITDQRNREERLLERETELEAQKWTLEQRTEQLEYQNERLDRFASIVSHDLRNPLTVAEGYADSLEDQAAELPPDSPVEASLLSEIEQSHDRMEDIIEDALTLAREGKAITETTEIGLAAIASAAWENVETETGEFVCSSDGRFEGDRDRLLNVFENLFRNAIEHGGAAEDRSPAGEVVDEAGRADNPDDEVVTIRVGVLEDETGFYVADDGPGISESKREEVLEHGFTTSASGTGLGLAIVTDVVRAHGWDIEVTESDAGGARFEIYGLEVATDRADVSTGVVDTPR